MINKEDQIRLLIHNLMQNLQLTFEEAKEELLRQKQEERKECLQQILQIHQKVTTIHKEIIIIQELEEP